MRKAKNIIICYWFRELESNPLDKIDELEKSLNNEFLRPFYTKDMPLGMNISLPRIEGIDKDKISYFNISLINSYFTYQVNDDMDLDDIVLYINSKAQLYFDVLKEVFNVDILYTSLKVEFVEENYDISSFVKLLKLKEDNYEDISFKKGISVDNCYYVNYLFNTGKEFNFDIQIKNNEKPLEKDIFDRGMLVSLKEIDVSNTFLLTIIEINDRLSFNNNPSYLSSKESIRGMINELKHIFNYEMDDLL